MSHSISEDSLQRFMEGDSSRDENLAIVSHLLRGCARCVAKLRATIAPEIPAGAYEAVFARLAVPQRSRPVLRFERLSVPSPRPAVRSRRA